MPCSRSSCRGQGWIFLGGVVGIALSTLSGCGSTEASPAAAAGAKPKRSFPVETAVVRSEPAHITIRAPASVRAFERVVVVARVTGVIESLTVREGMKIDQHTVLATIDAQQYALQVSVARAQLTAAQAEHQEAANAFDRRKDLGDRVAAVEITQWEARAAAAQARVEQRRAELALAELDQQHATVTSLVSGTVQERLAVTGQQVQRGDPIATVLHADPILVRFSVTADEAQRMKPGQVVQRHADEQAIARVSFVADAADPTTRRITVEAEALAESALIPGVFIDIEVVIESRAHILAPLAAVKVDENGQSIFVVVDGVVAEKVVTIGQRTRDGRVEILSGVSDADEVVVRGIESLSDGAAVRVVVPQAVVAP